MLVMAKSSSMTSTDSETSSQRMKTERKGLKLEKLAVLLCKESPILGRTYMHKLTNVQESNTRIQVKTRAIWIVWQLCTHAIQKSVKSSIRMKVSLAKTIQYRFLTRTDNQTQIQTQATEMVMTPSVNLSTEERHLLPKAAIQRMVTIPTILTLSRGCRMLSSRRASC